MSVDATYLLENFRRWDGAGKTASGQIISSVVQATGLTRQTIYRKFQALKAGHDIFSVTQNKGRGKKQITSEERDICMKVSAVKEATAVGKNCYVLSTERAIEIAFKEKLIDQMYTRSWVERRFKQLGITHKQFNRPNAAVQLVAAHANHVWLADATPLNKYYLNKNRTVVEKRGLVALKDKHLDDALRKDGLQKIWIYYVVDMFSKAYYVKPYAPKPLTDGAKNGGENSLDWRDFFIECFLEKSDPRIPLKGLPSVIYSDKGSGLLAGIIADMARRLDIKVETHMPGNSRAKGRVEGRISAYKRSFEPILNLAEIPNLERLEYFINAWAVHSNQKSGYYDTWQKSAAEHPIRFATAKNIQDATVRVVQRVVDAYGCVSIDTKQYFVSAESDVIGRKLEIYTNLDGVKTAWDNKNKKIYTCDMNGARKTEFGKFSSFADCENDKNRKAVIDESKKILKAINFQSLLPNENNLTAFPVPGIKINTHSPIEPDFFESLEDVRLHIAIKTGFRFEELPADTRYALEQGLESEIKLYKKIKGETVTGYCEIITNGMTRRNKHNDAI